MEKKKNHKKYKLFKKVFVKMKRNCLRCDKLFMSQNPFNKLCKECRFAVKQDLDLSYSVNMSHRRRGRS